MNSATNLMAAGLLLMTLAPVATATTYGDPSGDAFLGLPYLDIESLAVTSDGTDIVLVLSIADIRSDQLGTRYSVNLALNGVSISIDCYFGTGILVVGNPSCQGNQATASVGNLIAVSEAVALTGSVDVASDEVTVTVPYTSIGAASGDGLDVTVAGSSLLVGMYVPVPGDRLDVGSVETLA